MIPSGGRADRRWRPTVPLAGLGGLLVVYLLVPLVAFVVRLGGSRVTGFTSPGLWSALRTSVESATISTAIVATAGVPLAFVLARSRGRLARLVGVLVALPLALPPLMSGIVLIYIIGPYTPLGRFFHQRLTGSVTGIVISQVFVSAPFLVIAARSAFRAVDPSLEDMAAGLGLGPLERFVRVDLHVAGEGIRAGLLLTWLRAIGEFGANVIVAYHPYSLPVFAYQQFAGTGIPTTQAPTVLVLAAALVAVGVSRARLPAPRRLLPGSPEARPGEWPVTPVAFGLHARVGAFELRVAHRPTSHRLAILGPSGSGKSMTLRSLAGLLESGPVYYAGERQTAPAERRRVGYVPQGQTLIPGLTLSRHVLLGKGADPALGRYWVDAFGLAGLEDRLPEQLSGGQRQRACLASVLARRPRLLLLDEPFSALDAPVRSELRALVRRLQSDGLSTVLVTHDPEEAAELSDDLLVISGGRVLQSGPTAEVYRRPATPEVARLLGFENVVPAVVEAGRVILGGTVVCDEDSVKGADRAWVAIRAGDIVPRPQGRFRADVLDRSAVGGLIRLAGGPQLRVRASGPLGDRYDIENFHVIPDPAPVSGPAAGSPSAGPPPPGRR